MRAEGVESLSQPRRRPSQEAVSRELAQRPSPSVPQHIEKPVRAILQDHLTTFLATGSRRRETTHSGLDAVNRAANDETEIGRSGEFELADEPALTNGHENPRPAAEKSLSQTQANMVRGEWKGHASFSRANAEENG